MTKISAADEVWIATALLHNENPDEESFTVTQIVDRVAEILAINVSDGTILQEILHNLQGILRVGLNQYGSTESAI